MSNATDKIGCLSHRPNSRFFVMYEDFLEVAKVSEHQYKIAAFWRTLETMTNERIAYNEKLIEDARAQNLPIPETTLWIEIPYSTFVKRSLGCYKASSFQVAAAESERLGFSKSRTLKRPRNPLDPDSPQEDYKEYLFLPNVMQSVLNGGEYPTPIEINSPLLKSIAIRKEAQKAKRAIENNTPPIEINSPPPIEINSGAIEINRKKYKKNSNKKEKNRDTFVPPPSTQASSGGLTAHLPSLSFSENDASEEKIPLAEENATDPGGKSPDPGGDDTPMHPTGDNVTPPNKPASPTQTDVPPIDTPSHSYSQQAAKAVPVVERKTSHKAELPEQKPGQAVPLFEDGQMVKALPIQIKPSMPAPHASWPSAETAVQIVEAKKGRRYSDTTRTQELTEAKKVLKMEYDDGRITRAQFEEAWDEMVSWPFWKEKGVKPLIRFLRKDDKIITILDDLNKKSGGTQKKQGVIAVGGYTFNPAAYSDEEPEYVLPERMRR